VPGILCALSLRGAATMVWCAPIRSTRAVVALTPHSFASAAVVAACLTTSGASAQTETDDRWHGAAGASVSATSGNTDSSAAQFTAEAVRAAATHKFSLGGSMHYARNTTTDVTVTTANKWSLSGRYDQNFAPRLFGFTKLGLEGDKLIHLSLRSALAGGMGYKMIDTARTNFDLLGGVGYSADRYSSPQTVDGVTDTRFARASLFVSEESSHQLTETVSFRQRLEFHPGVSGNKASLAKFKADLGVAINSRLSLTVGLTESHNSKPPAGTKKDDLGLFTGINMKFGAP
jgi:putative salt-induced outer membrane protein